MSCRTTGLVLSLWLLGLPAQARVNEIWVTPTKNLADAQIGSWGVTGGHGDEAYFTVPVPDDLGMISAVKVVAFGDKDGAVTCSVDASLAADADFHDAMTSDPTHYGPLQVVKETMIEIDVSDSVTGLGDLEPGVDYIGLRVVCSKLRFLGMRLAYHRAITGPFIRRASTMTDEADSKAIDVYCEEGQIVTGCAARIDASSAASLHGVHPTDCFGPEYLRCRGCFARAEEDVGCNCSWQLEVTAFCVVDPSP